MRVKQLRKRGTDFIRTPAEPAKKNIPYGKYIYILGLVAVVLFSGQWFYHRYFFVSGTGFLKCEEAFIEARTPGRIEKIQCSINDSVVTGVPLVYLGQPSAVRLFIGNFHGTASRGYFEEERRTIELQNSIDLLKLKITQARKRLTELQAEFRRAQELLASKAITRTQFLLIQEQFTTAKNNLAELKLRLQGARKTLEIYGRQYMLSGPKDGDVRTPAGARAERVLSAPHSGVVAKIYKQVGEVAQVGEPIIKIINREKSYVKAYFPGSLEKAISPGDEVSITFDNGDKTRGVVQKIYPTAFKQPNEKKYDIELAERYIVAEILPSAAQLKDRVLDTKVSVVIKKPWRFRS